MTPLEIGFEDERYQREQRKQRRDREGGDEVILVVEHLDMERHGVGLAADMARDDRDRAELAHRAGAAQDDAVKQAPLGQKNGQQKANQEPVKLLPLPTLITHG